MEEFVLLMAIARKPEEKLVKFADWDKLKKHIMTAEMRDLDGAMKPESLIPYLAKEFSEDFRKSLEELESK